ncbi:MAG: TIGR02452 family protein [Synergistaceae bacterium]|nr:TIGR02452 family protein [Synergistaceae bacterium]
MRPTKQQLAEVFNDTLKFFDEDAILHEAILRTNNHTRVYPADFAEETDSHKAGKIDVIQGRTLQTALDLHGKFPDKKIAVLNFAASQTPGGGVKAGSLAQEESICRSSTLYPSLRTDTAREGFYSYHYEGGFGWRASDTCIYSPDVIICRDDDDYIPARLSRENFVKIDVVTCAAPHIFPNVKISDRDLYAIHLSRAKNILRVCAYNGVDILITGAFGCGAFKNPPELVAKAWREALAVYCEKFDSVIFAVYCNKYEMENYDTFRAVLR